MCLKMFIAEAARDCFKVKMFFWFALIQDRVFLCKPVWSGTYSVDQASFQLRDLLASVSQVLWSERGCAGNENCEWRDLLPTRKMQGRAIEDRRVTEVPLPRCLSILAVLFPFLCTSSFPEASQNFPKLYKLSTPSLIRKLRPSFKELPLGFYSEKLKTRWYPPITSRWHQNHSPPQFKSLWTGLQKHECLPVGLRAELFT